MAVLPGSSAAKACSDGRAQPGAQPEDEPIAGWLQSGGRSLPMILPYSMAFCFHLSFWMARTGPLGEPHFTSQQVAAGASGTGITA